MTRSLKSAGPATDLRVRAGSPEDTDRILALVKVSLGEGKIPRSHAYWQWKHGANPFGSSEVLVAEADGDLVGLRVFMRWEWRSGDQVLRSVRAVDTATHPDWQGRGIFKRLTLALVERMREEGVVFVFNTPNEQSRPGYLKMGWSSLGKTSMWIRPNRPLRLLKGLRRVQSAGAEHEEEASGSPAAGLGHVPELLGRPELASFLERLPSSDARFATRLTPDYLRWRYASVPGFQYYATWAFDGAEGVVAVYRFKRRSAMTELRICDLVVGPGARSVSVGRRLVRSLARHTAADFVSAMAGRRTPEERVLWGSGFLPAPKTGPILTVRELNSPMGDIDLMKATAWRPSIGALELF